MSFYIVGNSFIHACIYLFIECVQWASLQDAKNTAVNKTEKNPWNNVVYILESRGK